MAQHSSRGAVFILLVLSFEVHLNGFRVRARRTDSDEVSQLLNPETEVLVDMSADRNESQALVQVGTNTSGPCKPCFVFNGIAKFFDGYTKSLIRFFDANNVDALSGHLVKVMEWGGYGVHHMSHVIGAVTSQIALVIGALWSVMNTFAHVCNETLGTCAGVVAILGLALTLFFLALFFIPAVGAAVWVAGGLAGTGHAGMFAMLMVNIGVRHILGNICALLGKDQTLSLQSAVSDLKSQAPAMASEMSRELGGTTVPVEKLTTAMDKLSGNAQVRDHMKGFVDRGGAQARVQAEFSGAQAQWDYLWTHGGQLTKANLHKFVDPEDSEIVVGD